MNSAHGEEEDLSAVSAEAKAEEKQEQKDDESSA